jgi:hypothetical protein
MLLAPPNCPSNARARTLPLLGDLSKERAQKRFERVAATRATTKFTRKSWRSIGAQWRFATRHTQCEGGHGKTLHPDFIMAGGEMTEAEFTAFLADCLRVVLKSRPAPFCSCVGLVSSAGGPRCRMVGWPYPSLYFRTHMFLTKELLFHRA